MTVNPFAVTSNDSALPGVFCEHANRKRGTFLFRVLEIQHPVEMELVYSGWWFRQTIHLNGIKVWSRISWLTIRNKAEFHLPETLDRKQRPGRMEINFHRGLRIRRFRIWIADELIYDEVVI